jgi:mono/diheme cytochrome c family protein
MANKLNLQPGNEANRLGQWRLLLAILAAIVTSASLVSCYESNSEATAPPAVDTLGGGNLPVGNALNGKIFYRQNCSVCHAAGSEDTTRAFGAIDLANQGSRISSDMSHFDKSYNLMARFTNLDQERVDDLKRYLAGL